MVKSRWIIVALGLVFCVRFYFSTRIYNPDIWNHQAWMQSVVQEGWSGLYEREMGERARVNYPPLTLYSFYLSEQLYQQLPHSLQTEQVWAAMYKLPSLFADIIIAWLLWKFLPGTNKTKLIAIGILLLNPALWYNSVTWGQIESLSALTAILAVISLVNRRAEWLVLSGGIALLTKQNVLPLIPLLAIGLGAIKPNWKKVGATTVLLSGITLLAYAPLIPRGHQAIAYVLETYWTAMSGQVHQHLASVNALNFWYAVGMNNVTDSNQLFGVLSARVLSTGLTMMGLVIAMVIMLRDRSSWYQRCWRAVCFITLWTFLFTTRMHERHSYMLIIYLLWLYPTLKHKWEYVLLSLISWFNVYAVWQGYFWLPSPNVWEQRFTYLSWIWVLVCLKLGTELFQQNGIKAKIVNSSQA